MVENYDEQHPTCINFEGSSSTASSHQNQSVILYGQHARDLHLAGLFDEAERSYQLCLELDPENMKIRLLLSSLYIEQGLYIYALTELKKASNIYPEHSKVNVLIAEVYERLGMKAKAINHLLGSYIEDKPGPQITYHLACTYLRDNQFWEALKYAKIFIELAPESKKAALLIIDIYIAIFGYTKDGLTTKEFDLLTKKEKARFFYQTLVNHGRYAEISILYGIGFPKAAIKKQKNLQKLEIYFKNHQLDDVFQTVDLFPGKQVRSWNFYYDAGKQLLTANQIQEAASLLELAYQLNPKESRLLRDYCEALFRLRKCNELVTVVNNHFSKFGVNIHLFLLLAKSYAYLRDDDKAKDYLHRAIRSKPDHKPTLAFAALYYYRDNSMSTAEYYARECLSKGPIKNSLASWILDQLKNAKGATRPETPSLITKLHMGEHFENNYDKPIHGVFSISVEQLAEVMKNLDSYKYQREGENFIYRIPYPSAGYEGGMYGDGHVLNKVVVVTRVNNQNVITSYPVN